MHFAQHAEQRGILAIADPDFAADQQGRVVTSLGKGDERALPTALEVAPPSPSAMICQPTRRGRCGPEMYPEYSP
jgi:hypothetical protein